MWSINTVFVLLEINATYVPYNIICRLRLIMQNQKGVIGSNDTN
jgi:hypothetical protein